LKPLYGTLFDTFIEGKSPPVGQGTPPAFLSNDNLAMLRVFVILKLLLTIQQLRLCSLPPHRRSLLAFRRLLSPQAQRLALFRDLNIVKFT
jgi:hypothetical protein